MPTYAVRAPLVAWLEDEARRAHEELGPYRLLDVGCGEKPYLPLFEPHTREYVGVDAVENPRAELLGPVEALPVEDGAFQVVLCAQVLEHCDDPAQAVRELHRATAPGGRVLVSTHGTMVYHPAPADYWRWTHTGLERLFRENGFEDVTVRPGAGSAEALAMLIGNFLHLLAKRGGAAFLARPFISVLNAAAAALDRRVAMLRDPVPGALFANLHVVAVKT
jgi:SAM-dependent methyltransferase